VLAARTESVLAETAKALDPSGERVAWARSDITSAEDCESLTALAIERFGTVDAMVQVAAYEAVFGGLHDTDFETWRRAYDTNVLGSLTLIRAIAPRMKSAGGGSIVLIGSQSMYEQQLPQAGYAASVPSWMWGPPVEAFVKLRAKSEGVPQEQIVDEIASRIPLGEIVPDEDVAEAVLLLASDRARSITGQALMVNGGEMMR
jgi:NAD(P)-dependent dehydrogenase (short-subunit alcohol dehydrogenase family)